MKSLLKWKWLPAILFWGFFAVSLYFYERHPWLDSVWYLVPMMFLLLIASCSLVQAFRHRQETTIISYRGIPRWLEKFSLDEEDPPGTDISKPGED